MTAILDVIAKARKSYETMISSPEERAIYNDWGQAWGGYVKGAEGVVEMSRKSIGRSANEARDLLYANHKLSARADELLQKGIDLNNTGADTETKSAADGYSTAFLVIVGAILAAMLGGALVVYRPRSCQ